MTAPPATQPRQAVRRPDDRRGGGRRHPRLRRRRRRTPRRLGFDAIELHGAHGYLIDQFFWDGTNVREDAYGAKEISGRARFAADILRAVRKAVGPDYPVIIRVSQWKQQDFAVKLAHDPKSLEAWLGALVDAGADDHPLLAAAFWEPEFEGSDLNFAGWAKKVTGVPTITVGSWA
jgi:2,4-dienoyl-CoA reductase-like NADH-dependent reductase (Old Yellow Enzyme family)